MEPIIAAIVLGVIATGTAGLPDRNNREWIDTTKRVCAAGQVTRADLDMRGCILSEMERKRAALLKDLKAGEWRAKR
jgi:hypothetical protein